MATVQRLKYTLEQYLDFENRSPERHEYYRGEIFLMTGGSLRHSAIVGNLYYYARQQLECTNCSPQISDQRIAVSAAGLHTYPDVAVVCGPIETHPIDRYAIANPSILFEVLSPSTERYDRGQKFELYRQLESLREYVLVSQDEPHIERFVRQEDGSWSMNVVRGLDTMLELSAVGCQLPLKSIYQNVEFTPQQPTDPEPQVQVQTQRLPDE